MKTTKPFRLLNVRNTTDKDVFGLLDRSNTALIDENSNKDAAIVSTQRDLIAGEVSKDIARRKFNSGGYRAGS
mgnify:CR=1 FL=1